MVIVAAEAADPVEKRTPAAILVYPHDRRPLFYANRRAKPGPPSRCGQAGGWRSVMRKSHDLHHFHNLFHKILGAGASVRPDRGYPSRSRVFSGAIMTPDRHQNP